MRTTEDERRSAVRLAKRIVADRGASADMQLLAAVVVDAAEVFQVHAPVIHAAKHYITPTGKYGHGWADLVAAVVKLHEYEKEMT